MATDPENLCSFNVGAENSGAETNCSSERLQRKRVEYWSKTYRMWIPAEITAVDDKTCAVQVNVKPGVWLSSSDWDKKLRVAVYLCSNGADEESRGERDHKSSRRRHDTACKDRENINESQRNDMYPKCPLDEISRCHLQDMDKGYRGSARTHRRVDNSMTPTGTVTPAPAGLPMALLIDTAGAGCVDSTRFEGDQQAKDAVVQIGNMDLLRPESPMTRTATEANGDVGSLAFGNIGDVTVRPAPVAIGTVDMPASGASEGFADNRSASDAQDAWQRFGQEHADVDPAHSIWVPSQAATEIPPVTYITGESSMLSAEGRFAGYRCPQCGQGGLESIQDALEHCRKTDVQSATPVSITSTPVPEEPIVGHDTGSDAHKPASASVSQMASRADGHDRDVAEGDRTPSNMATEMPQPVSRERSAAVPSEPGDEPAKIVTMKAVVAGEIAYDEVPNGSVESRSSDPMDVSHQKATTRILGYCCPKCGQRELATLHEAVQHCQPKPEETPRFVSEEADHDGARGFPTQSYSSVSAPAPWTSIPEPCAPPLPTLPGEPVAYNSFGQPIIARQVDAEGGAKTMVLNDDGSCDVFGKQTIASLLSSTESEAEDWMEVLSDYQMRGLVHEMGQRLLEASQLYQARLSKWETFSDKANLAFFGLSEGCTDRELDVAYRQLSKKMHPDKNGGTEESKERFQEMKKRYEALKKKRGSQDNDEPEEKEQTEQDDQEEKNKDDKTIEFDPTNRDSLHGTAKKMLSQLSTLDTSMATLVQQLKRHGL